MQIECDRVIWVWAEKGVLIHMIGCSVPVILWWKGSRIGSNSKHFSLFGSKVHFFSWKKIVLFFNPFFSWSSTKQSKYLDKKTLMNFALRSYSFDWDMKLWTSSMLLIVVGRCSYSLSYFVQPSRLSRSQCGISHTRFRRHYIRVFLFTLDRYACFHLVSRSYTTDGLVAHSANTDFPSLTTSTSINTRARKNVSPKTIAQYSHRSVSFPVLTE